METVRLIENEYILKDETDVLVDRELCISEIKGINDCIRKVNKSVIWIPTKRYIVISCIAMALAGLPAFIAAFIYRHTELVNLFFIGLIGIPFVPLIILSCNHGAKKKNKFIQTAEIYPAKITNNREWKEWHEGSEGGVVGKRIG